MIRNLKKIWGGGGERVSKKKGCRAQEEGKRAKSSKSFKKSIKM